MRVGLALPHYDFSLPGRSPITVPDLVGWARRAEALGFDSGWISDHLFYSLARHGEPADLQGSLEPITALAAAAAATERLRLGFLVLGAPFRPPALLRSSAMTLGRLAGGGRIAIGLGAGWYEDEFVAFGYPFGTVGDRFGALERSLQAMSALRDELDPADMPSVVVGAKGGDRALRFVARHADRWNTVWRWTPEALGARIARLHEIAEEEGRDPSTVHVSVGLYTIVGEDPADLRRRFEAMRAWRPGPAGDGDLDTWRGDALVGTADECVARIADYEAVGVDELIVAPATLPFAIPDDDLVELIAREIVPRVA